MNNSSLESFSQYVAELHREFFVKVCSKWREIALTMRETVFDEDDNQHIDIHDIKCKEWGFLLKKLFGVTLGTGDYGHLTIDHSAMLLRHFRSMYHYSGQGFEASHKLHRQLYSRATNHDQAGPGESLDQILTHWYATHLLELRYTFREAVKCLDSGKKNFHFRGCGWRLKDQKITWSQEKMEWIRSMDRLLTDMFGTDFLEYEYDKVKGTQVSSSPVPAPGRPISPPSTP
ncbi:uncharacterized protein LOC116298204, partial [Actinia tenebrosa]|uniref:Uncharacterized protein LOC116298204 n=1 Tax=Actinia tenebrosa TaxID=6105 RepID=A0A6P8IAY7_ACTTE